MKKKPPEIEVKLPETNSSQRRQVSLSDIATRTGLSRMSVSMALRNHPRISESTRAQVKTVAEEMGYHPNPLISRAVGPRSRRVDGATGVPLAIITFEHPIEPGKQEYDIDLATKLGQTLGYAIRHFHLKKPGDTIRLGNMLYRQGIEAVLIDNCLHEPFADHFQWDRFCSVSTFGGYYELPCNHVDTDSFMEVITVWHKIRAMGARRINFVFYRELVTPPDRVWQMSALLHCRAEDKEAESVECIESRAGETDMLREWLDRTRPDVVVGFSPIVYWWMKDAGWPAPERAGFVSISLFSPFPHDEIAGMVRARTKVLSAALDQLDLQVRRFERGTPSLRKRIFVASEWIDGASLPSKRIR
ncbi:MAG: helix-turn-helix domain-containing protein [Verrucomicrobiota bacterium]|nr:helix-turn-helix domain-containing protein [Verrucomicrobiota bacterium]